MSLRDVRDDRGVVWTIYAIVPDWYDDRIGIAAGYERGWLCFQSSREKWRFLGIPKGWEALSEMELLELMTEAVQVRMRV